MSLRALAADNMTQDVDEISGDEDFVGDGLIGEAIAELGVAAVESTDPEFTPSPQDIVISERDASEAVAFLQEFDPETLGLNEGEGRTYTLADADLPGSGFQVLIANIPAPYRPAPWSAAYVKGLSSAAKEMFRNVTVLIKDGAANMSHSLIIAGRSRDLGIARQAFADALALAGFNVSWRGYVRRDENASAEERLASYGFSLEGSSLSFRAISGIPESHRAEAVKLVLATLAEDLSALNRVVGNVRGELRSRKGYDKVQRLLEMHDITEDGLYYLLTRLENPVKLDPKGDILPLLKSNREFMALAEERVGLFTQAISIAVTEARRSNVPAEQITEIIGRYGLTMQEAGVPPLRLAVEQPVRPVNGKVLEMRAAPQ